MADWINAVGSSLGNPSESLPQVDADGFSDGTDDVGFVTGSQNKPPRECGNCIWMALKSCGNPNVVKAKSMQSKLTQIGRVTVDADDCCNSFQSNGNVLLWIVRHGVTDPDEQGISGGLIDDPLNENGREQARDAADYLRDKHIQHVVSSDMDRAQETAEIIRPGQDRYIDKNLRPWDVGKFSGRPHSDAYKEEFDHFIDNPSVPMPDGESMEDFSDRMVKVFSKFVDFARRKGPTLVVTHSKNFTQFKRAVEDKNKFKKPNDDDKVNEGGIMVILDEAGVLRCEIVYNRGDGQDRNWS